MAKKKYQCAFPDCGCNPNECLAEERENGKQLSFGERVVLEDGIDHKSQAKDEGRSTGDILFALFIMVIIVAGAIGAGFVYGFRKHLHRNPPDTDYISRSIKVDTDHKGDTTRVYVIDKRMYLYQTLSDEQKQDLKKAIE